MKSQLETWKLKVIYQTGLNYSNSRHVRTYFFESQTVLGWLSARKKIFLGGEDNEPLFFKQYAIFLLFFLLFLS